MMLDKAQRKTGTDRGIGTDMVEIISRAGEVHDLRKVGMATCRNILIELKSQSQ